jgi:hypothetical protein
MGLRLKEETSFGHRGFFNVIACTVAEFFHISSFFRVTIHWKRFEKKMGCMKTAYKTYILAGNYKIVPP